MVCDSIKVSDTPEVAGLAAVDRFLETWNSRDKEAWADSLHYPHVRPSPRGPSRISPSAAAYAAAFSYERVLASGWDHSEWDYRRVLHTSADKVHLAGEWSRYDSKGTKLLTNPVVYVATRIGPRWGVQARFGADSRDPDTSGAALVRAALERAVEALASGDAQALERGLHAPVVQIEPGAVLECSDAAELVRATPELRGAKLAALELVHVGDVGANAALDLDGPERRQAVMLMTNAGGAWGLRALSVLRPQATA